MRENNESLIKEDFGKQWWIFVLPDTSILLIDTHVTSNSRGAPLISSETINAINKDFIVL